MKKKIHARLTALAIIAVVATVIGTTAIYYRLFQNQIRADLSVSARLLKDTRFFESGDFDAEKNDLSMESSKLRVTWVDVSGEVLYDNDRSAGELENHLNRPEIKEAFDSGVGESVRKSDTLNKNTFYYAILLDNGTVLRVATDAQSLWSVFLSAAPVILIIILFILIICVIISRMLTLQLLKPIEMMAKNLENSDYESPYKELDPFTEMIRTQHTEVLSAAKARQDFTANVSHELKTPLTAISGYAELLETGAAGEEQRTHFCREIKKNSDRLLSLINDIIKLSELDDKGNGPTLEEMDLYEAVYECMDSLSVNAATREVELIFEGDHERIYGSKDLIKELVENLVQNAIRYTNPSGRIDVTVGNEDGKSMLRVRDNGIGIPVSEQDRIFERFYRVDKSRSKATGGTGLGLAIVKHIVEIHDAKIELESAPGEGTGITIVF